MNLAHPKIAVDTLASVSLESGDLRFTVSDMLNDEQGGTAPPLETAGHRTGTVFSGQPWREEIDTLRLMAIVLIVYLHGYNLEVRFADGVFVREGVNALIFVEALVSQHICAVAVPVFSVISGYLFFRTLEPSLKGFRDKLARRARSLAVPYLLWSAMGLIAFSVMQAVPYSRGYFTQQPIRDRSFCELLQTWLLHPIPYQFWYIRELIIVQLLSPVLFVLLSRIGIVTIVALGFAWLLNIEAPGLGADVLFFFALGSFLSVAPSGMLPVGKKTWWPLTIWLFLAVVATVLKLAAWRGAEPLLKLGVLTGVAALWLNAETLKRLLGRIGPWAVRGHVFFVFAAHEPLLTITKKLWVATLGFSGISMLSAYVLCPALVICICMGISILLTRNVAFLHKVLVGGR